MVSAKSLRWDGTRDSQETAWKTMWHDQSRPGAVIMSAQVGGEALPWQGPRRQILPVEGLGKAALNNKVSSDRPLGVNRVGLWVTPTPCLASPLTLQWPSRLHAGHPAWGMSSENSQPWGLSGPSEGRGGVSTMSTFLLLHRNGYFDY